MSVVDNFICDKLTSYDDQRDIPSIKGTSGLSPYLALGIVSPKQLLINIQQRYPDILTTSKSKTFTWVNELIWREFKGIFFQGNRNPPLVKTLTGNNNLLNGEKGEKNLKAWCEGGRGNPL